MAKYAYFDSAAATPAPVIGWIDTVANPDVALPPSEDLLPLTDAQWQSHYAGAWAVSGGALVAYVAPEPVMPPNIYIGPASFLARFTPAELTALAAADPTWGTVFNASVLENGGKVDVTNATLVADLDAAATAGTLTTARVAKILNLAQSSP